jgi:molecular chaperone DnaJ
VPAAKVDYYELLGVSRDADEETIRRAFHAAAREWHPDISDSPDAERRFRELAEAYSVLSKPGPRLLYDRYGYRGRGNRGFDEALWEAREQGLRGESVRLELDLRWFEALEGARKVVEFEATAVCEACDGRGTTSAPDPDCPTCGGTGRRRQVSHLDLARVLQVEACPECSGEVCPECGGSGRVTERRRLRLRIPPQIEDGTQLRVGGEGHAPVNGSVSGDLLVDVHVAPKPRDPRLIRYLALALFLAAVAALIAYLFL